MKINAFYILLLLSLTGCSFTNTYNDLEDDRIEGKIFLDTLYKNVKGKNFNKVVSLASDSLIPLGGKESLLKLFAFINSKVGNLEEYTISEAGTQRI